MPIWLRSYNLNKVIEALQKEKEATEKGSKGTGGKIHGPGGQSKDIK
jgi:hypothetical protein